MSAEQFQDGMDALATDTDRRSVLKRLGLGGLAAAGMAAVGGAHAADAQGNNNGLITVTITNVLNNLTVDVDVRNNNVALLVCAVVQDINAILVDDEGDAVAILSCDIEQRSGS